MAAHHPVCMQLGSFPSLSYYHYLLFIYLFMTLSIEPRAFQMLGYIPSPVPIMFNYMKHLIVPKLKLCNKLYTQRILVFINNLFFCSIR
jgi:hypothetical protein